MQIPINSLILPMSTLNIAVVKHEKDHSCNLSIEIILHMDGHVGSEELGDFLEQVKSYYIRSR